MKKPVTYQWMDESAVVQFFSAFILKACEQDFCPETIGEYLALCLDGIIRVQKEREIKD